MVKVHKENQVSKWNCENIRQTIGNKHSGEVLFVNLHHLIREHLYLAHAIFLYAKVDLLVEGDEVGQAAADSAWYFYVKVVLVSNGIRFSPFTAQHV